MSDAPIEKMNFKQLRAEVQSLRDELAIMKRSYEDILFNIDTENLSPALTQKGKNIQKQIDDNKNEFESKIEQTAQNIKMTVTATYKDPVEVDEFDLENVNQYDKDTVYYEKDSGLYWHFAVTEWESSENGNFGSVFEQTDGGFYLKGNVKLDGNLISNGEIEGSVVRSTKIEGYNAAGEKEGLFVSSGNEEWKFSDLSLYDNGELIFSVYATLNGAGMYAPSVTARLAGDHNHGIGEGVRLAISNDGVNVDGFVVFHESGAHVHYIGAKNQPNFDV